MNKKFISMIFIIIAGEAIFMLPFLIPRIFRPVMLEAWNITNTDMGLAFGAYGITSMISYLIGGPFADKYSPRKLIVASLLITLLGSIVLILIPSKQTLIYTYGFFGVSTILLMWGALIKVTHEVGGADKRATAMGILDSGRGLTAAIVGSVLTTVVAMSFTDVELSSNKIDAINLIYSITSGFIIITAICVWYGLKGVETKEAKKHDWNLKKAKKVFMNFDVWLLGVIVLTAYCGYKNIDNLSVYLVDVHNFSLMESSKFTTLIFWVRPIAALLAGIVADKIAYKMTGGRFLTLTTLLFLGAISQLLIALNMFTSVALILSILIITSAFTYALRAIYFSVFGGLGIPDNIVGTTVGVVSVVGFLPDMFFGATTGHLIDKYPGAPGYSYVFLLTGTFLLLGTLASFISYRRMLKRN